MKLFRFKIHTPSGSNKLIDVQAMDEEEAIAKIKRDPYVLADSEKWPVTCELEASFDLQGSYKTDEIHEMALGLAQMLTAYIPRGAGLGFALFLFNTNTQPAAVQFVSDAQLDGVISVLSGWLKYQLKLKAEKLQES